MKKIKYIIPWILVLCWMGIIFFFSAQKAEVSSSQSGGFAEILAGILHPDIDELSISDREKFFDQCQFIVRKTAHFSAYGLLGILTFIACRISKFKIYPLISAAICLIYSISDEIHQIFVEGRSNELRDVLIDFSGSLTGICGMALIFYIASKIINKRGTKNGKNECI
ncbi:MAG: VanZ family protein [Porcipelethomonas sp.]